MLKDRFLRISEIILSWVSDIPDFLRHIADLIERNVGTVALAAVLLIAVPWAWRWVCRHRDRGGGDDGGSRPKV